MSRLAFAQNGKQRDPPYPPLLRGVSSAMLGARGEPGGGHRFEENWSPGVRAHDAALAIP